MPLATDEIDFVRNLVAERSGNVLSPSQGYLVEAKLKTLAQCTGMSSPEQLVAELRRGSAPQLKDRVTEAMTINETSFFRDIHPFDALREVIVPGLIERRQAMRQISIWCAACSSGQEPYSLAILLKEHFPKLADWSVRIVATDISEEMLNRSREGIYTQFEVNRGLPARLLVKYFDRLGATWQVQQSVRKMIDFRKLNLTSPWPQWPQFDIVSIRNVLIYFDQPSKQTIFDRIRQHLRQDGYLILGGSETLLGLNVPYRREPIDKSVCYRPQ